MKTYLNIITGFILAVTLTSCAVSKNVPTPADAIPNVFRFATEDAATTQPAQNWRSFFTDATLQTLIDSALVKNNDLLSARQNIEIARLRLSQAKLANLPTLNLQVSASSANPSGNSLNGISLPQFLGQNHLNDFTAGANLAWEADIWGKIKNRKKAAVSQYLQSAEAKNALQTIIVSTVARGFYNLLMLDAQLKVAKKNLELSEKTLFMINLRFESGQVTSLAQQQAEAQKLVSAQLIPFVEQQIAIQENALSVLTGRFPGQIARTLNLGDVSATEIPDAGVPARLVSFRPDVKSAELYLQEANARVGSAKAELYPSLTITASGGVNAFEVSNWFTMPASLFGAVAGGLTQPLFNGRRLRAQYEVSKSEREKAVIGFRQSVLTAVAEVSNALVSVEKLKSQYNAAETRKNVLEKAVKNADLLFQSGMANYLEVITAQDNLLQSEIALLAQRKAQLDASAELYRSLGGGWQ